MQITQDSANLIDTLASASGKLSGTQAGKLIEAQIITMLPGANESIAEALRQDNIALQIEVSALQASDRIKQANLELARSQLQWANDIVQRCGPLPGVAEAIRDILAEAVSSVND